MVVCLSACGPLAASAIPYPTNTQPPPTLTYTPTIVWFPPTATITPLPTIENNNTPVVEIIPKFGQPLFNDDFSDSEIWPHGKFYDGSIAFGKNELSLVVSRERGYLSTIRQGTILSDFYLEITANPSICRGEDEYGLILRATSNVDFFRFSLTCNGQTRVDRLLKGQASSPQPLTFSGAVPPGAPSMSKLAVWSNNNELHFYVNEVYQFTVRDPNLQAGGIGVFVRAAGEDMVTVNFLDLQVFASSEGEG